MSKQVSLVFIRKKDCGNCNFCQLELGGEGGGEYVTIRGFFSIRVVNVSGGVRTQKNTMMNHNLLSQTL